MGLWGTAVFTLGLSLFAVSGASAQTRVLVEGFDASRSELTFVNYRIWSGSSLPDWAQVAHCTSLVLMARQMHYYAEFAPQEPRLSAADTEALISAIYWRPTDLPPEGAARITIPGYADLRDLSRSWSLIAAMQRVMGDALLDGVRPGWHWTPLDLMRMDGDSNEDMEQYLKETIDRGRLGMLYIARGADLAHAVLVFGYEAEPGQRRYLTYDPNRPGTTTVVSYNPSLREFYHPRSHGRDGWVLHPYRDMRTPPYPSWF